MRAIFLVLISISCLSSHAAAQWEFSREDDAFDGDMFIASTFEGFGYGIGFRCRSGENPDLVFMTPEEATRDDVEVVNKFGARLLVVVDDEPKVTVPATLELNVVTGRLSGIGRGAELAKVIESGKAARRRIAVAMEIRGKTVHQKTFSSRGSTKAFERLMSSCGIDGGSAEAASANPTDCTEIDKVSGVLTTVKARCAKYRLTQNGETALGLKSLSNNPACLEARLAEHEGQIDKLMSAAKLTKPQAEGGWCDATYLEHKTRFDSLGMQLWIEPK